MVLKETDFNELVVVGCDGTVVNTGAKGGVIRCLENKLGRSLHWIICLLHFNELPFRSLFEFIDGGTSGLKSFAGPIGVRLKNVESLPVVSYSAIQCSLPDVGPVDLSKDQKYLLDISKAIQSGSCPPDLSCRNPGILNHARWLTCANRTLRLYIFTEKPTIELKDIGTYILKVYVPMWFAIRCNSSIKDGPKHLFNTIQQSRYLPKKYLRVVDATIARNAFFAFPENVLISMMTDERREVRLDALRKILQARELDESGEQVLPRALPEINFSADDYYKIIDWSSVRITSPPILNKVTNQELSEKLSSNSLFLDCEFLKYPCHTIAVERMVKLVTEASCQVCGSDARDGFIRCTLLSRQSMPNFETKNQFSL